MLTIGYETQESLFWVLLTQSFLMITKCVTTSLNIVTVWHTHI